jgi:hypothetical protein
MPSKTQREREAEQRKAKLDHMQEQVEAGSLVIRQMTDAERERFATKRTRVDEPGKKRSRRSRVASRPLPPPRRG